MGWDTQINSDGDSVAKNPGLHLEHGAEVLAKLAREYVDAQAIHPTTREDVPDRRLQEGSE